MALTIGANIASLRAQRELAKGSDALSRSLERLASGSRLNRASDDPASLSIASQLRSNARLFTQALRNTTDGISILAIADSAMGEMSGIVTRITELAEQAANGTYSSVQRGAMDREAQALIGEYQRIVATTQFNGVSLLSGTSNNFDFQVGIKGDSNSRLRLSLDSLDITTNPLGTGAFGASTVSTVPGRPAFLFSGDFNGDGMDDLVSISDSGAGTVLLLSNGDGTFRTSATINNSARGGAVGDFNRDGKLDFASTATGNGFDVYLGDGAGGWSASFHATSGVLPQELTAGDLNGDGKLDIIASNGYASNSINVFLGNGDGTFAARTTMTGLSTPMSASSVYDFNHDGKNDVVIRGLNNVYLLYGNGDGYFSLAQTFAPGSAGWGTIADINNDGYMDYLTELTGGGSVGFFLGNSNGSLNAPTAMFAGEYLGQAGDINGDGITDITTVLSADNSAFKIRLGNSDGSFLAPTTNNLGLQAHYDALADLNGDGVLDYAAVGYNGGNVMAMFQGALTTGEAVTVDLTSQSDARDTLTSMQELLSTLTTQRGKLGAYQSRLDTAASVLQSGREATAAALGRIEDADIAAESANMVRQQILQQAASSVLAQANQLPNLALALLKG